MLAPDNRYLLPRSGDFRLRRGNILIPRNVLLIPACIINDLYLIVNSHSTRLGKSLRRARIQDIRHDHVAFRRIFIVDQARTRGFSFLFFFFLFSRLRTTVRKSKERSLRFEFTFLREWRKLHHQSTTLGSVGSPVASRFAHAQPLNSHEP